MRSRRFRPLISVALVVSSALLAVGCGQQLQPTSYDETYRKNFMFGCSEQSKDQGGPQASSTFCGCVYKGLVEKVNFDDAKAFEEQQAKEDPGRIKVPKNIQAVMDSCKKKA